jgi:hypothetical protein
MVSNIHCSRKTKGDIMKKVFVVLLWELYIAMAVWSSIALQSINPLNNIPWFIICIFAWIGLFTITEHLWK